MSVLQRQNYGAVLTVIDAFMSRIPGASRRTAAGWLNFDCPLCGDRRKRGGIIPTPTGGFRYRCFNGGCVAADTAIGWEPGSGLGGRCRMLYEALGGEARDLPIADLMRSPAKFDRKGSVVDTGGETPTLYFSRCELPSGTVPVSDASPEGQEETDGLIAVLGLLESYGPEITEAWDYMWSPSMPGRLVIPYLHGGITVGWLARDALGTVRRFMGSCPPDYVFKQDTLFSGSAKTAIMTEGVMDAIAIGGVAVRGAAITKKQELALTVSGRRVIVLPDQDKSGLGLVDAAERNGWEVSVPGWDAGVKDAVDAVKRYGSLFTVQTVVSGATRNYQKAKVAIIAKSRSK